jgi:NAD-dependent dihydropyrimidine dehydrogenase PreA subunit
MVSEKCISCGICTKRCKQDVFKKDKKVINVDASRCIGCGICVNSCPQKALILKKLNT